MTVAGEEGVTPVLTVLINKYAQYECRISTPETSGKLLARAVIQRPAAVQSSSLELGGTMYDRTLSNRFLKCLVAKMRVTLLGTLGAMHVGVWPPC